MEYKSTALEMKAEKAPGEFEGLFSVFNNLDDGGDVTERGAFSKTLAERGGRVKVLYGHQWDKLVGPTPTLSETSEGLFAKGKLTLDSFWGKEVWALLRDGALSEGSYGYNTIKADFDDHGIRRLRELKLYEISFVPLGMNPLTAIRAVKSAAMPHDVLLPTITEALAAVRDGRLLVTAPTQQLKEFRTALDDLRDVLTAMQAEPPQLHSPAIYQHRLRAAQLALVAIEN